jgi:hypothetical protein
MELDSLLRHAQVEGYSRKLRLSNFTRQLAMSQFARSICARKDEFVFEPVVEVPDTQMGLMGDW